MNSKENTLLECLVTENWEKHSPKALAIHKEATAKAAREYLAEHPTEHPLFIEKAEEIVAERPVPPSSSGMARFLNWTVDDEVPVVPETLKGPAEVFNDWLDNNGHRWSTWKFHVITSADLHSTKVTLSMTCASVTGHVGRKKKKIALATIHHPIRSPAQIATQLQQVLEKISYPEFTDIPPRADQALNLLEKGLTDIGEHSHYRDQRTCLEIGFHPSLSRRRNA